MILTLSEKVSFRLGRLAAFDVAQMNRTATPCLPTRPFPNPSLMPFSVLNPEEGRQISTKAKSQA